MKSKSFLSVILILYCIAGLSFYADAADKSEIFIKDIEYLAGDDFVQLHFKIDKMIPIPDVFYPDKNDNKRIIMRIHNGSVVLGKDLLTFNSSVINTVAIDNNPSYCDVEIRLKEQVNYRVFTNRKGLYIEFPKVKNLRAAKRKVKKPTPKTTQATVPKPARKKRKPPAKTTTKSENLKAPPRPVMAPPASAKKQPDAFIKDIILKDKKAGRVTFDIVMSRAADFYVIPIPTEPVRLAIDFKNTHSKRIKKIVDYLNVKGIRGAYNTSSVYRLVFDLHYLKNYKVSPKNPKGNIVEVAFYDKMPKKRKHTALNLPKTQKKPAKKNRKGKARNPNAKKQKTQNKKKARKKAPLTVQLGKDKKSNDIIVKRNGSGVELTDSREENNKALKSAIDKVQAAQKKGKKAPPIRTQAAPSEKHETARPNDFFGEEKSEVAQDQQGQDSGSGSLDQITYTNRTIAGGQRVYTGTKMGFNFHNADIKDVIKIISKISGLNIVMDPGISGKVTTQLKDVPWDQALDLFLKINGLDVIQEGNILRIGSVDRLASEAEKRRLLKDARQMEDDLEVFTKTLSYAKVSEVATLLRKQLSKRGEILEDLRTNTLIISEIPDKIKEMQNLIVVLDTPNPQVSIEARIVETRTNFIESLGIQWGYNLIADASHGNQTTLKFPNSVGVSGNQFTSDASPLVGPLGGYAVNLPATGATTGTVFTLGNVANTFRLDMALSAMQSDGQARIISAPKTTTQNNMEATIMQGKQIPVQTIQNNTITVVYRPAALELKVTPQITADGTVVTTLEIKNNAADFGNLVNGIPPIDTQSIKTTVMVPDGGTIVIGGMYRVEKTTTDNGVPFLSKIPLLGNLFKNSTKRKDQRELLVFITPRIIK
jgi:type IV pilus assembly protein PilQ